MWGTPAMREVNFHKFQQLLLPIWGARSTRSRYQVLTGMPELQSLDSRDVLKTVLALWSADVDAHDLSEQTFDRYRGLAQQYVNYTYTDGLTTLDTAVELYEQWLGAKGRDRSGRLSNPAISVRHLRSCAIRAVYATAATFAATTKMPRYEGRDGSDVRKQGRPLNECEVDRCRSIAATYKETRLASAVALGLCGAGTADIGNMNLSHIDLRDGSLVLPGSRKIAQRRVAIAGEWEHEVLTHRVTALQAAQTSSHAGFIVNRTGSDASRQAGAAIALTKILSVAGFDEDAGLKPSSFQRWAGVAVFDQSASVVDVARLLGSGSLDAAARSIDLDWRNGLTLSPVTNPLYRPRVLPW